MTDTQRAQHFFELPARVGAAVMPQVVLLAGPHQLNPRPVRWAARFLSAPPPEYECTLIFGYFGKRLGAPGLADAGLPGYQNELPSP